MQNHFLSREEARHFYDHFGKKQDWQRFYESPAIEQLISNSNFDESKSVFELGCGTGAFALALLENHLPRSASYFGVDISTTMIKLSRHRLSPYKERIELHLTDGILPFEVPDASFDRFVSNYVLDLLPPEDIKNLLQEAHRMLKPGGKLCLVSLTHGRGFFSHSLTTAWNFIQRLKPSLVGGCRPIELLNFISLQKWKIDFQRVVNTYGIPSEIIVATKLASS